MIWTWRTRAALLLLLAFLFVYVNRHAYRGYFRADDLDTLSYTPNVELTHYFKSTFSLEFSQQNFRPAGSIYYRILEASQGLNFPAWVGALHAIHLLNCILFWFLLRRLELDDGPAAIGVAFFEFHKALLEVYWRPMFVYDLLCCTYILLALLAYRHGRWLVSLILMLLAYRCKEIAVTLPAILLVYEFTLGDRRWKRLIPFFALSLSFGIQAMLNNASRSTSPYSLFFTASAFSQTLAFYSKRMFGPSWLGLITLALPFLPDSRLRWSTALIWFPLIPLLPLVFRQEQAYLYVPQIGLSLAVAALAALSWNRLPRPALLWTAAIGLWWLAQYSGLTQFRGPELERGRQNRTYCEAVRQAMAEHPNYRYFLWSNHPAGLDPWGIRGLIYYLTPREDIEIRWTGDKEAPALSSKTPLTVISWFAPQSRVTVSHHNPGDAPRAVIRLDDDIPFWQLGEGWTQPTNRGYLTQDATATLFRPAAAELFELQLETLTPRTATLQLGQYRATQRGRDALQFRIPPGPAGEVVVRLQLDRPATLLRFGFPPR